ncbi:hypothetical protein LZ30DRAFT_727831 [Colletotrichum cereale]|nr:hypothetical protein LZ30DRAFT_727831 [Colletotrichum cereale]
METGTRRRKPDARELARSALMSSFCFVSVACGWDSVVATPWDKPAGWQCTRPLCGTHWLARCPLIPSNRPVGPLCLCFSSAGRRSYGKLCRTAKPSALLRSPLITAVNQCSLPYTYAPPSFPRLTTSGIAMAGLAGC